MKISLMLNGEKTIIDAQPDTSLMEVLRSLNLNSVKCGCGNGVCGSCTVLLNDKPVSACKIPVALVNDSEIITMEHFVKTEEYTSISKGFEKAGIKLCGYCNAGKYFTTNSFLKLNNLPTAEEIEQQIKHLAPCCTNTQLLIRGIKYSMAFYQKLKRENIPD